jgi:uncharacterized protein (DUF1330 family)
LHSYRSISDESALKAYGALALPVVEPFGGRIPTSSTSRIRAHEAGLELWTILVEFDSWETAVVARNSEAYQRALQALGSRARAVVRMQTALCWRLPDLDDWPLQQGDHSHGEDPATPSVQSES